MANVDPYVQEWVAGTNGRLYVPLINRLARYPIPECPFPKADRQLLLDIGCGWGRWMLSAAYKDYVPVGIDIKLDAALAARRVLQIHGLPGFVVVADLKRFPFKSCVFDVVFSYSVIQHTHRRRAYSCLDEVHRVLKNQGYCLLQFPTKYGIANFLKGVSRKKAESEDYDSWCVRYYTLSELETLFFKIFGNFSYQPDCFLGIGVQRSDIDILPWRYKPIVILSEGLKALCRLLPICKRLADSIYVLARKKASSSTHASTEASARFLDTSGLLDAGNLEILDLLACPATGCELFFDRERQELVSKAAALAYPIIDGVPIMLVEQARVL